MGCKDDVKYNLLSMYQPLGAPFSCVWNRNWGANRKDHDEKYSSTPTRFTPKTGGNVHDNHEKTRNSSPSLCAMLGDSWLCKVEFILQMILSFSPWIGRRSDCRMCQCYVQHVQSWTHIVRCMEHQNKKIHVKRHMLYYVNCNCYVVYLYIPHIFSDVRIRMYMLLS